MAEVCQRMTKAKDMMHTQWLKATKNNEELTARLQQVEAKLQEPAEHLQKCDYVGILHVPDKHLWDQL